MLADTELLQQLEHVDIKHAPLLEQIPAEIAERYAPKMRVGKPLVRYNKAKDGVRDHEELTIDFQEHNKKLLDDLRASYEKHDMKTFYATAEKVLRIKHGNPVVKVVLTEDGDVIAERDEVNQLIGEYFDKVYKAPERMEDIEDIWAGYKPESTQPVAFSISDVREAMKACNFNKGLGPDGFHGGILLPDNLGHILTNTIAKQVQ